ncbi:MAG: Lrp/AsnC family transcriptional regulator [Candidatus Heimdallarchaeota archaeon]|nr:MAG: Lrp/AsnC family transcriptional regulator [Candidatus Heimdallarchaeota archaeon]
MITNLDDIDSIDRKIITLMKKNSRMTRREIAEELEVSPQTIQNRINTLQEKGIILGYTIITNEKKLGKEITAFILVALDRARQTWALTEQHLLLRVDELEIAEMHHITGDSDVIIKVKTRSLDSLEHIILKIVNLPGVARSRTLMCLSSYEYGYEMKRTEQELVPSDLLWNFT